MIQGESINESVERFAALCAQLDDGIAPRALVLVAAGLDERACSELRRRWLPLLAAGEDPDLAVRFARSYAHARQDLARASGAEPSTTGHDDADTERDTTARVEVVADADRTVKMTMAHASAALPFKPVAAGDTSSPSATCSPADPTETTLEVPCALPTAAALPFLPPPPTGRRQRLQRFDTQTGRLLAFPVWIDEPTPTSPRL